MAPDHPCLQLNLFGTLLVTSWRTVAKNSTAGQYLWPFSLGSNRAIDSRFVQVSTPHFGLNANRDPIRFDSDWHAIDSRNAESKKSHLSENGVSRYHGELRSRSVLRFKLERKQISIGHAISDQRLIRIQQRFWLANRGQIVGRLSDV